MKTDGLRSGDDVVVSLLRLRRHPPKSATRRSTGLRRHPPRSAAHRSTGFRRHPPRSAACRSTGLRRHLLSMPLAYPRAASPPNATTSPGSAAQLPPMTCALPATPPSHRSILGFPHRTPSRRPLLHQRRHPAPQMHLHQRMAASINIDSFTVGCSAAGGFAACLVVSVSDAIAGCLHSPTVAAQLGLRRHRSIQPLLPLSDPPASTPHRIRPSPCQRHLPPHATSCSHLVDY
ncbi:hypothetical protein VPH35_001313 [Triticum aestivum]